MPGAHESARMNPIDPLAFSSASLPTAAPSTANADDVARFEAAMRQELDASIHEQALRKIIQDSKEQQEKLQKAIRGG
jgi:hypothetical protein